MRHFTAIGRVVWTFVGGVVALLIWTCALVVVIGLGMEALEFPDPQGIPVGQLKWFTFWASVYVAVAGLITGLWPAILVARWFWMHAARVPRFGAQGGPHI